MHSPFPSLLTVASIFLYARDMEWQTCLGIMLRHYTTFTAPFPNPMPRLMLQIVQSEQTSFKLRSPPLSDIQEFPAAGIWRLNGLSRILALAVGGKSRTSWNRAAEWGLQLAMRRFLFRQGSSWLGLLDLIQGGFIACCMFLEITPCCMKRLSSQTERSYCWVRWHVFCDATV